MKRNENVYCLAEKGRTEVEPLEESVSPYTANK